VNIAVFGVGYVGLVTAACLADFGHQVWCVDKCSDRIEKLAQGTIPIYEPGLEEVFRKNVSEGRLKFVDSDNENLYLSEVFFICVGTPSDEKGKADLSAVFEVAEGIGSSLGDYKVIVIKSTVPPGTAIKVKERILETVKREDLFDVVSSPEFLREGSAVYDFLNPERIVLGLSSQRSKRMMEKVFAPFAKKGVVFVYTDPTTAEIIKYASNVFLATKISFINSLARLCDTVGGQVEDVAKGMGLDSRIGPQFLRPGPGFGGSCFPKDLKALLAVCRELGVDFPLVEATLETNQAQMEYVVKCLKDELGEVNGKNFALFGLAFKAGTDDVRESPALKVARLLLDKGADLKAFDYQASNNARLLMPELTIVKSPYEAVDGAHGLLILTEWEEFKELDWEKIKSSMRKPFIYDTRNLLQPEMIRKLGFTYRGMGCSNR
jgi:UDPglucose 6-dehydrogenase